MSYQIGDCIAHPLHGAGVISAMETKRIDGVVKEYYVMRLPVGDMLIKVPVDTCDLVGVRPLYNPQQMEDILAKIPEIELDMDDSWNKRYRENMLRVRSGDMMVVSGVIKGLTRRDCVKRLSTGERKILHSAKQILVSEMVLSMGLSYEEAEQRLNAVLG